MLQLLSSSQILLVIILPIKAAGGSLMIKQVMISAVKCFMLLDKSILTHSRSCLNISDIKKNYLHNRLNPFLACDNQAITKSVISNGAGSSGPSTEPHSMRT